MATLTRANIIDRALEALGVKAAGETAATNDTTRVGEAFDTIYDQIHKESLAPFATSAVPEWAQSALIHMTALESAASFGVSGDLLQSILMLARKGRQDLATQVAAVKQPVPVRVDYY